MVSDPTISIGLSQSFASRRGRNVHLQLQVNESATEKLCNPRLHLHEANGRSTTPTAPVIAIEAGILTANVEADVLTNGYWRVELISGDAEPVSSDAIVFVSDPNPIALLLGRKPAATTHRPITAPSQHGGTRSAAHVAERWLDRVLVELPPRQAKRARARIHTTARKILP